MTDKKQRHHELKDASSVETYWIEPIDYIPSEEKANTLKPKTVKEHSNENSNGRVEMRQPKEHEQHTFKHDQIYRKTIPKNSV